MFEGSEWEGYSGCEKEASSCSRKRIAVVWKIMMRGVSEIKSIRLNRLVGVDDLDKQERREYVFRR